MNHETDGMTIEDIRRHTLLLIGYIQNAKGWEMSIDVYFVLQQSQELTKFGEGRDKQIEYRGLPITTVNDKKDYIAIIDESGGITTKWSA